MIFDENVAKLAVSLGGNAARVFLSLPSRLDFRAWKRLPQNELAESLGVTQGAVSKALRELERHCVVERRGKGALIEWRLCRSVGYRGRAEHFHADERADEISQRQAAAQGALRLGPLGVVKGGRKSLQNAHDNHASI